MARLSMRTSSPSRLNPADHMYELGDAVIALAGRMAAPRRSHHDAEAIIAEGERIAQAVRRIVRG